MISRSGRTIRSSAFRDATWLDGEGGGTTRVYIHDNYFANPPLIRGHIRFADDGALEISNVTLFSGHLTHMAAIRWGLFGVLRLGVIRRERVRAALRIGQRGKGRAS